MVDNYLSLATRAESLVFFGGSLQLKETTSKKTVKVLTPIGVVHVKSIECPYQDQWGLIWWKGRYSLPLHHQHCVLDLAEAPPDDDARLCSWHILCCVF